MVLKCRKHLIKVDGHRDLESFGIRLAAIPSLIYRKGAACVYATPHNRYVLSAAAAAAGGLKFDTAGEFESVINKIDFYRCCFFQKFFIDKVSESFDIKDVVCFLGLIQSHC